jgi:hypothetical protein
VPTARLILAFPKEASDEIQTAPKKRAEERGRGQFPRLNCACGGDTAGTGIAAGHNPAAIQPGDDVVVLGAGPVGLGAIQSARIGGVTQIISVEPIKTRREMALKLDATLALDPNVEGAGLVNQIRDLCKGPTDRRFADGRGVTICSRYREGPISPSKPWAAIAFLPKSRWAPIPPEFCLCKKPST